MGVFIVKVFLEQFLPLQADAVIEAPEVQDKVKDVIAGDDPAVLRNGPAAKARSSVATLEKSPASVLK